jgi:hypothetical protein
MSTKFKFFRKHDHESTPCVKYDLLVSNVKPKVSVVFHMESDYAEFTIDYSYIIEEIEEHELDDKELERKRFIKKLKESKKKSDENTNLVRDFMTKRIKDRNFAHVSEVDLKHLPKGIMGNRKNCYLLAKGLNISLRSYTECKRESEYDPYSDIDISTWTEEKQNFRAGRNYYGSF